MMLSWQNQGWPYFVDQVFQYSLKNKLTLSAENRIHDTIEKIKAINCCQVSLRFISVLATVPEAGNKLFIIHARMFYWKIHHS